LEAIAGVKLYLARNSFFLLGGGLGLPPATGSGANPDVRGFIGIVFEPNIGDRDGDGIKDDVDQCPNEPENYDDFEDHDGCPDRGRVIVHQSNIEILDKIYFETDKAIIKPESFPILDAIAATVIGNPDIQLIEIQGHADERGDDNYNLKLTDDRAHAVMKYLVDKGVEQSRLTAKGYGETKPIDNGHNEDA